MRLRFPEFQSQLIAWALHEWVAMSTTLQDARFDPAGTGPVYQGRFKSFPIQRDHYFLTVCRYVDRNALRANLVDRAED